MLGTESLYFSAVPSSIGVFNRGGGELLREELIAKPLKMIS